MFYGKPNLILYFYFGKHIFLLIEYLVTERNFCTSEICC